MQQGSSGARPAFVQVHETEVRLPGAAFGFFHDMLATSNYYILIENPMGMDFRKLLTEYMFGRACIAECLYLDSAKPMKVSPASCILPVASFLYGVASFLYGVLWPAPSGRRNAALLLVAACAATPSAGRHSSSHTRCFTYTV